MRIFSGIQPTGRKHLGNYIGAITQYVAGQDRGEGIYCVVDLHALTVAYEPEALRDSVYDTAATLLAAGLDPDALHLLPPVRRAGALRAGLAAVGRHRLRRAEADDPVQGQGRRQRDLVSAGLFTYPVLMAADVLAYRADEVPVGDDQRQHIELMRDVAERFNARFGETLVVPEARIPEVGARIMDLQSPERKMSTTGGTPQGTVYVLDEPAAIAKKFRSAVTDSGSEVRRGPDKPGITNLIEILAAVRGTARRRRSSGSSTAAGYGAFKQAVADAVVEYLAPGPRALPGAARRRGRAGAHLAAGAEKAGRSPPRRSPTCARRWASGPVRARR